MDRTVTAFISQHVHRSAYKLQVEDSNPPPSTGTPFPSHHYRLAFRRATNQLIATGSVNLFPVFWEISPYESLQQRHKSVICSMNGSPSCESASSSSFLNSSSTTSNFSTYHENYSKSLARGRNPKSIPRKSELWYHTKNSNDRRDKIAKGHQFWGVVDNSAGGCDEGVLLGTSSDSSFQQKEHGFNINSKADGMNHKDDNLLRIGTARKKSNNFKTLNSSRFDVKVRASKRMSAVVIIVELTFMCRRHRGVKLIIPTSAVFVSR